MQFVLQHLFFFLICFFEGVTGLGEGEGRDLGKEKSFIHWFTSEMVAMAEAKPS